jgi:hypothetical protein
LNELAPLPQTAREHSSWWENKDENGSTPTQAKAWIEANYDADVNFKDKTVTFRKTKSRHAS